MQRHDVSLASGAALRTFARHDVNMLRCSGVGNCRTPLCGDTTNTCFGPDGPDGFNWGAELSGQLVMGLGDHPFQCVDPECIARPGPICLITRLGTKLEEDHLANSYPLFKTGLQFERTQKTCSKKETKKRSRLSDKRSEKTGENLNTSGTISGNRMSNASFWSSSISRVA